ncbi:RAD51-associated protein 1 [Thalassophryne amazonica]|uniref:RAD51-associated protein 1 n=1 Tax=Thalassophryne amazonica TaxID=390379 RepID=UPI001471F400|nr:RAD51-associated protein 1 [Thalassophryne amazonica]
MLTLAMERPSRKTKVLNYCESQDDDDEDFTCTKAPPSKKAREDIKQQERKKSLSKSSSQEIDSQSTASQNIRRPLDEKLYERDIEAAITLSLLNSADGLQEQPPTNKGDVKVQFPVDENTDPASLKHSNCSVDSTLLGLDKITTESESPCSSPRQRKAASKLSEVQKRKFKDEDEDYEPKATPDSESGDDFSDQAASEDEEFTVNNARKSKKEKMSEKTKRPLSSKKEKKPRKAPNPQSQAQATSTPVRSPTAKPAPESRRPASSTVSKPAVSLSPAGGRIPKWNPPGLIGKSPTSSQNPAVKSPGHGLRLGLSRLVRVKPLHPGVATH